MDEIEKRQDNLDELVAFVAVFAKEQEHIQADVREIKADIKALTASKLIALWMLGLTPWCPLLRCI